MIVKFFQKKLPYIVCFSAAIFFAFELVQLHILNALSAFLVQDLKLTASSLSYLNASYLLADVIFLLPSGMLLDRFSVRRIILMALVLCLIGIFGFSVSQNIYQALLFRFCSGIGNAFCFLSCMMLIAEWFPKKEHSFMMGVVITIGMLGGLVAQTPVTLLAQAYTWRQALFVDGVVGAVILVLTYFTVFDSPSGHKKKQEQTLPFYQGLKQALSLRENVFCGLYTAFLNLPLMVIAATFGSLFLQHVHHISLTQAPTIVMMLPLGTLFGSSIYGHLATSYKTEKFWMLVGALLSLVTIGSLLYMPAPMEPSLLFVLFFLLGLFTSSQILGYPIITASNPQELCGTAMGISAVIIMGSPMLINPLVGILLDAFWDGTLLDQARIYSNRAYQMAFLVFPITFVLGYFLAYKIRDPRLEKKTLA